MQTNQEFAIAAPLPQLGPYTYGVVRTNAPADHDAATRQTVDYMRAAAIVDSASSVVRRAAREALDLAGLSRRERASSIFWWVKTHVRFRDDEDVLAGVLGLDDELDLLIRPAALLSMDEPAEDCDGFAMLTCAMLLASSIPCEPVTIKADPRRRWRWSHVYCQAVMEDGEPFVLDASRGELPGWEPPRYYDRQVWPRLTPAPRSSLQGYGLADGDWAGEAGAPDVLSIPSIASPPSTSGVNWNQLLQQIASGGLQIAKMQATPVGYVQTPTLTANYGPGATIPGVGQVGGGTLLLAGAALLALLVFGRK